MHRALLGALFKELRSLDLAVHSTVIRRRDGAANFTDHHTFAMFSTRPDTTGALNR